MILFTNAKALIVSKAYAQSENLRNAFRGYCEILHTQCGSGRTFLAALALRAGQFFAVLIAGAAILAIIYGSVRLITSAGNDQGKEEAKKVITTAIIGLLLALAAESIFTFIGTVMGLISET